MANYITRVGIGFDVHRFDTVPNEDNFVTLGGVRVPHKYRLLAHSDGDVALHAITDALLGAMALGDIGEHFPPSDDKWRNADSGIFLQHAAKLISQQGGAIVNIDVVVIAEKPKLSPYKQLMAEKISELLALNVNQVSVKATTTEKLGYTGREEGIAAQAVCAVKRLKDSKYFSGQYVI